MSLLYKKAERAADNIIKNAVPFEFAQYSESSARRREFSGYSYWKGTLRAFRANRAAFALLIVMAVLLLFTFIQPLLPRQHSPNEVNNNPLTGMPYYNLPPCAEFPFGTNNIGQDLWARLWASTRTSLLVGFAVAAIDALLGIVAGVLWGYVKSLEIPFTELYNILDNVPTTIVLILCSLVMKPGVFTIIFAMSITGWIGMARFVRNQVVIIRDMEYNLASRCLGTPFYRIAAKNLLPYLVSVIMLRCAASVPAAIGSEVFITYIGLGLPASVCSLGNLINAGRLLMMNPGARYQLIFPTAVLCVITVSFYVVGSALGDAADPKNHR